MRGSSLACAACWGSRRGRPRRWRGPPGPRSQPLAHPPRSPLLLWRPPARRPWSVRGPSPAFAACWGSRRGRPRPWRVPPGLRPQPLARPPCSPSLLWRPPARHPWPVRGPPPAFAACRGSRRDGLRRWRGPPGPRSQPLARPSRFPLRLRQPSAMRLVPAPGLPHVSAACRGRRSGAAAWLAAAAVSASCASGAPSRGGAAGLAAWAAGAVISAGSGSRAGGGGPTSTAASASLRSSRSARVSPVHSGEAGERERDRRWWRSSRWGEPSESAITVILVGMRGGRRALPTTSWCISAVPWAVPCGALRGGGGEGVGGRLWRQPRTAGGRRPSTGIGRGGGGATRFTRRAIAPSLGRGPGPWAPGGCQVVSGGAAPGGPP